MISYKYRHCVKEFGNRLIEGVGEYIDAPSPQMNVIFANCVFKMISTQDKASIEPGQVNFFLIKTAKYIHFNQCVIWVKKLSVYPATTVLGHDPEELFKYYQANGSIACLGTEMYDGPQPTVEVAPYQLSDITGDWDL
jgi:hypothetical protein